MLTRHGIPSAVENFIVTHLHSVEQLEVLLFLWKSPEQEWTAEAVASALQTNPLSVTNRLEDLYLSQLLSRREDQGIVFFQYSPIPKYKDIVEELARYYPTYRVRIIELIYSKPSQSVLWFADAFRIKKGQDE